MSQAPFKNFSSLLVPLLMDDVDTDQIIPARFLIATGKEGYGENLFRDLRFNPQGEAGPEFPLNNPLYETPRAHAHGISLKGDQAESAVAVLPPSRKASADPQSRIHPRADARGFPAEADKNARILLAHRDFGSGSSREHAVWALSEYGFKAVIAITFGDIFKNNCYKNGLLPVSLPEVAVDQMHKDAAGSPQEEAHLDLERQTVSWKGKDYRFEIDPFVKACLRDGVDEIGYILKFEPEIAAFEQRQSQE
ncbi:MAG: 3-isopropylmalate dehydratase small subunit [Patescibacteria group bacterium]